jgi:hypothetical protein
VDDRFYSAFLPPQVKVCGRTLDKFTLWHHFVLSAIGSPVALGGDKLTVPDLLAAAKACTLVYGESRSLRPSLRDIWWRRQLSLNPRALRHEAQTLYRWIEENGKGPLFWRKTDGETNEGGSGPQCLLLVCSLMNRGGMSREQAWNTPLGEALWMDATFAKLEGVPLHFVDEEEATGNEGFDLYAMTEAEVRALYSRDLPANLVEPSIARWKKEKEARRA